MLSRGFFLELSGIGKNTVIAGAELWPNFLEYSFLKTQRSLVFHIVNSVHGPCVEDLLANSTEVV